MPPAASAFTKVPASSLFVSEPNPTWFGNPSKNGGAGWDEKNWLKSRFHFSFAEYSHGKPNFGCLRVMNDDRVQPSRGFGTHGHANMEIVTYVVEGELTHKDTMGTAETLGRGSVQFMTAGTGVQHSEFNHSPDKPLRFIQMWVMPTARGLSPNYGSATTTPEARRNRWCHMVTGVGSPAAGGPDSPVLINQDCNFFVAEVDAGGALAFEVKQGRQAYVLCVEGAADVKHGETGGAGAADALERHDGCEVIGPRSLNFAARADGAHILVVEMAERR